MWLKILVPLVAIVYIGYKVAVALEIRRARLRGDADRVTELGTQGFGFQRFMLGLLVVALCFLVLIAVLEMRG